MEIQIERTKKKRRAIDFDQIPLGQQFTDHMFICDYEDGRWQQPRVVPMGNIALHPASMALHYGQAIFEGMKCTLSRKGIPRLFRPYDNASRLNNSAARMGMPSFPEDLFVNALLTLVRLDQQWIPDKEGSALYLRPFMFASEAFIGMRAATRYSFMIIASPAGPFFNRPIRLWAEPYYVRAAQGGTGEAKAAGNYAAAIRPTEIAKEKGYDQVLWLDARERRYIQEVGTMNVFFKVDGVFYTPNLDGSVLHGITRDSVIKLLRAEGYQVLVQPIAIDELVEAAQKGLLEEAFGTGTAVGIAFIESIGLDHTRIAIGGSHKVGTLIQKKLTQIKSGELSDTFNWMVEVPELPKENVISSVTRN